MSVCERCGASFSCAMRDGGDAPCWCAQLPPLALVQMPTGDHGEAATCLCPACLSVHIEQVQQVPNRDSQI